MVLESPNIPCLSHPSEPAVLNASNLELLTTPREESRVQEFVTSQTRYAKAQANEGRAIRASWDISTPEKDKMRLHQLSAGFETPVLKPRAVEIVRAEPTHRPASQPHSNSSVNKPTSKSPELVRKGKAKATSAILEAAVSPKRRKILENTPRSKITGTSNPTRKECRPRSDTDEEHLARLTERRERKRAKREIMNPREVKASTRGEKENKDDAKSGPDDKKRQKLPAGLALMHGFSSASVGKSRLTIKPPPNFGVFNKGRASAKIKVDESKRTKQGDRFLNSRPPKLNSPEKHLRESETPSKADTSNVRSSSPVRKKRSAAVEIRRTPIRIKGPIERNLPAASPQCDEEMVHSHVNRVDCRGGAGKNGDSEVESKKSRSPARSASWVIEQDDVSLPSTTSDVAIASVNSKPQTAFLDIRAAAWSRILKSDLYGSKAPFPPLAERDENPQAISTLPGTITTGVAPNAHIDLEELATIGPWESASQVARNTVYPQEQRFVHSRYFELPHSRESRIIKPETRPTNSSLGKLSGIHGAHTNCNGDGNTKFDERLVFREASVDHQDDLLCVTPPADASPAKKPTASPEEHVSVLYPSSLDSVDRALLLDLPGVTYRRSEIHRRTMEWHEFKSTPGNLLFHQYGLDTTDTRCDGLRPFLHSDSEPTGACTPGVPTVMGTIQDSSLLSFDGEYYAGGLEGNREDQAGRSENYPALISESPVFASDDIPPNTSHDCQNVGQLFIDEDAEYEEFMEREEDCTSLDLSPADWSAFLEDDADRATNIHLWSDEAWPRREAGGETTLHEGSSHLTTVQKVEQDVAKRLKGHWFPHKF